MLNPAAIVTTILGTGLMVANQSNAFFGPAYLQWRPMILVYLTPFVAVSASQVIGTQAAARTKRWQGEKQERFLTTLFANDIIRRAVVLDLAIGGVNIGINYRRIAGRHTD